ncbi:hypothetical protein GCM10029992_00170 [Glycomyces albus]
MPTVLPTASTPSCARLLCGLAIAALLFPLVAMAGLSTKAGFDSIDVLSEEVAETDPPLTSYVYASDGETLISLFYDEFRRHVSLDEVAPVMQQAMISAEDTRFYEHNGIDYRGIMRAFVANQSSGIQQGASTITMQYVRGRSSSTPSPSRTSSPPPRTPRPASSARRGWPWPSKSS